MPNADWYARKLGRQAPPAAPPPPGWVPPTQQQPQYQQQQPYAPQQPVYEQPPVEELPKFVRQAMARQERAGACPECESPNYASYRWGGKDNLRCYDCGYPVVQSGSGAPSTTGIEGIPTAAARQVSSQGSWNPGGFAKGIGIIGRDPTVMSSVPNQSDSV